jgi:hypothetical protein
MSKFCILRLSFQGILNKTGVSKSNCGCFDFFISSLKSKDNSELK